MRYTTAPEAYRLDELRGGVERDEEGDEIEGRPPDAHHVAGGADDGTAIDVDPQPGPEIPERREITVEELLKGVLFGAEPFDGNRHDHEDQAADHPLDGEEPDDRRVPKRLAAENLRCLIGRPPGPGLTNHEITTAQTTPRFAARGVNPQPVTQRSVSLTGRSIGLVTLSSARSQLPPVMRPSSACGHHDSLCNWCPTPAGLHH
jgi:hypothetical protein